MQNNHWKGFLRYPIPNMPNIHAVPSSTEHANAMRAVASSSPFLGFVKRLFAIPRTASIKIMRFIMRMKATGTTTPM